LIEQDTGTAPILASAGPIFIDAEREISRDDTILTPMRIGGMHQEPLNRKSSRVVEAVPSAHPARIAHPDDTAFTRDRER